MRQSIFRTFIGLLLLTLAGVVYEVQAQVSIPNKQITIDYLTDTRVEFHWSPAQRTNSSTSTLHYYVNIKKKGETSFTEYETDVDNRCSSKLWDRTPNTTYTMYVRVYDRNNNISLYYDTIDFTTYPKDTTAPKIDFNKLYATSNYATGEITVHWPKATDNMTSQDRLEYYVNALVWDGATLDGPQSGWMKDATEFTFKAKDPDTEYWISLEVKDEALNHVTNWDDEWSYKLKDDETAPSIPNKTVTTTCDYTSIVVTWNSATDDKTLAKNLKYEISWQEESPLNPYKSMTVNGFVGQNSITIPNLKPGTKYFISIRVHDEQENSSFYDAVKYIHDSGAWYSPDLIYYFATITSTLADTQGPTLSDKVMWAKRTEKDNITLAWTKGIDNVTPQKDIMYTIEHKTLDEAEYHRDAIARDIDTWKVTGLEPETSYNFRVRAEDALGNVSYYDIAKFKTHPAVDKAAPAIGNVAVSAKNVTYNSVTLSWTKAYDQITPQSELLYYVYVNGSLYYKALDMTTCTVTGLQPQQEYTFEVRVEDIAMNSSSYRIVRATTTAQPVVVEKYPLFIEGTQVTSANANDFWGDGGTVQYAHSTRTLTLSWAVLYSKGDALVLNDDITINLIGWNTIDGNINADNTYAVVIQADKIKGENSSLTVTGQRPFYGKVSALVLRDCTVAFDATGYSYSGVQLVNGGGLGIYNATLKVKGGNNNPSIRGINDFWMDGSTFESNHTYDKTSYKFLNASGKEATDEIIISTTSKKDPQIEDNRIWLTDLDMTSAKVSWNAATDDTTPQSELEYKIYFAKYGSADYELEASGKNLTSYTFTNLQPGTTNYVTVYVFDKEGNRAYYQELAFTTKKGSGGLKGDVNHDGFVNIQDVTTLVNIVLKKAPEIPEADINEDNSVNIQDVTALVNIILQK